MATINDFALDATVDVELGEEFMVKVKEGAEKLSAWLTGLGYEVSTSDADQLVKGSQKETGVVPLAGY